MILFLDIEHPKALKDPAYRTERAATMEFRRKLFEELSGQPCRQRHFTEFHKEELEAPEVTALVTSGNRSLWDDYDLPADFAQFQQAIAETSKPVLGICGGHQLIGLLQGGNAAPLRPLEPGEKDVHPDYAPGYLKEWGFYEVEVLRRDPLLEGFAGSLVVKEMHFWQISELPRAFEAIAANGSCPVQAMRHAGRPIYGVQFHPEFFDPEHRDGERLLRNFFAIGNRG